MLGAERFQDTEASLAGDDGRYDPGNPGKAEKTHQVVVGRVLCDGSVPVRNTNR